MAVSPRTRQVNAEMRNVFRVVGAVLLIAGITLLIIGFTQFSSGFNSSDSPDALGATSPSGGFGSIMMIAGGGFLTIFGMGALRLGFLRAGLNYVVGEGSEAIQSVSADIATGFRSAEPQSAGTGPFCSKCGAHNNAGAHFCDACGSPLVTA